MEDENLYDEFGNYIGPEMDMSEGSGDDSGSDSDSDNKAGANDGSNSSYAYEKPVSIYSSNSIVLCFSCLSPLRMEVELTCRRAVMDHKCKVRTLQAAPPSSPPVTPSR